MALMELWQIYIDLTYFYNICTWTFYTGQTTDNEFCTLRTQGHSRPLHLWQLIHDAREAVRAMKKATLEGMITPVEGNFSGS